MLCAGPRLVGVRHYQNPHARHTASSSILRSFATTTSKYKVLFFGTDDFALPTLERLLKSEVVSHVDVVCPPDSRQGRGHVTHPVPVKSWAMEYNENSDSENKMTVFHPNKRTTMRHWTDFPLGYDVGIVVDFRYLLPSTLLESFRLGCINVHPSLLPSYRGAAPIHHAILNGEAKTGVTIMQLDPHEFDVGKVVVQKEEPISSTDTYTTLAERLSVLGAEMVDEVLSDFVSYYHKAKSQSNFPNPVIEAPKIEADDGCIAWKNMDMANVFRRWRALQDSRRGVYSYMSNKKRVVFRQIGPCETVTKACLPRVEALSSPDSKKPGGLIWYDTASKRLLATRVSSVQEDGDVAEVLPITALQPEGKRALSGEDFRNGYLRSLPHNVMYLFSSA